MNFKTIEVSNTNKLMKYVIDEFQKFNIDELQKFDVDELLKSIL
jgi:hypothetical protein